jgi:SUF system NifU family Fe-S assembly protein
MSEDLYQQAILDLAKAATGAGRLDDADASVTLDNPLCGDRITIDVKIADGHLAAVAHKVRGCALCEAAAAVIGSEAAGRPVDELRAIHGDINAMLTSEATPPWPALAAFDPVRAFKSRHECVLLPFEALAEALDT